jgi:2-keto-4-pentenoate hydratase
MVADLVSVRITRQPIPPLTHMYCPFSLDEAYRVQDGLTRMIVEAGDEVVGYKIAFAGGASRAAWGIDEPAYGRLFRSQAVPDGGTIDLASCITFHIEVEVAFVMDKPIDRPVEDVEHLKPLVRSVHAGFDVPTRRFDSSIARPKAADVIADGAAANRFVLGPAMDPARTDVDRLTLAVRHDGREVYRGGSANVMGSPWRSLLWLANSLLGRGRALRAGDVVLAGAVDQVYSPARPQAAGTYVGDCGALGRVTCKVLEEGGGEP